MKKRTFLGVGCIVLALVIAFVLAPMSYKSQVEPVKVVQLTRAIAQGQQLTESDLVIAEVPAGGVPDGALTDLEQAIGQYTTGLLFAGDIVTSEKITNEQSVQAEDVLATLDGSQVAMSITIDSFAAGVSGKLQNGDVISLIVTTSGGLETLVPSSLKYVEVLTTTTSSGYDTDEVETLGDSSGRDTLPATITVLVSPYQAVELAKYESNGTIHAALCCRGGTQAAQDLLAEQQLLLSQGGDTAYE